MKRVRLLLGPFVVALLLALAAVPARAGELFQATAATGAVIAIQGTPHLFIADEQGVLHWGGDTRGLQGRYVNWSDRREVTVDQLRAYRRGDPWLSAGLLKIGDPIYLVKWETPPPLSFLGHQFAAPCRTEEVHEAGKAVTAAGGFA